MLYQLIAHLDKKLHFATVSAQSAPREKNELAAARAELMQTRDCYSWLEDPRNMPASACDGGL